MASHGQYLQLPDEAPRPRMWKSLGWVHPQLEAFYHLETFSGELDLDREAELRAEMVGILPILANASIDVANAVFARTPRRGKQLLVRFMGGLDCVGRQN